MGCASTPSVAPSNRGLWVSLAFLEELQDLTYGPTPGGRDPDTKELRA
jgi:hypothetical protein